MLNQLVEEFFFDHPHQSSESVLLEIQVLQDMVVKHYPEDLPAQSLKDSYELLARIRKLVLALEASRSEL